MRIGPNRSNRLKDRTSVGRRTFGVSDVVKMTGKTANPGHFAAQVASSKK
jgi:hypothetical protein